MKARQRNTIVALMIFALTGLTAFQVYWINNALELSETQFSRNVQESLVKVAGQLEEQEAMRLTQDTYVIFNSSAAGRNSNVGIDENARVWFNSRPGGQNMKYRIQRDSVIFMTAPKDKNAKERIRNKVEMLDVAVQRIFSRGAIDISQRISDGQVDSLLDRAFEEKGISIAYSYGVIEDDSKGSDRVILTNAKKAEPDVLQSNFRATLFPNDLKDENHFLAVYFPNQSGYILREIGFTLVASLIFIGIITGSFIYTMKVIGRQKKLSEIKNDFINNMTHEFKTPIATISLASQVLAEEGMENKPEARKKYLGVIRDENERLARQVERVLESSLLENNQLVLNEERTSLHDLLKECIRTFKTVNKEFEFKTEFEAGNDLVTADVHHMNNVFCNLLDNAVKYSGNSRNITIRTRNAGGSILVSVKDHGIGMESGRLKHIFDSFYRIPKGNLHDVKGFGLGLSYVQRLVLMHDGTIDVLSVPGQGSEFKITLPNAE